MTAKSSTSATAAAAAKIAKPKKAAKVSHAKPAPEQTALPLPVPAAPEFGQMDPAKIIVLNQVRKDFDEDSLRELAADIADHGILQPLTVRYRDGQYVLVAGERRLRAAMLAKLASVPVLITALDDSTHALAQLAENIQRQDLTLAEEAAGIRLLFNELQSVKDVAEKVHKSSPWVSKRLAASHPELAWQARNLLEDGSTEDLELILTIDKIAKIDYWEANQIANKVRKGEAGRQTARDLLDAVKIKAEEQKAATAERDAKFNDPDAVAKRKAEDEERKRAWDAQREIDRMRWHVEPVRQMGNFWDWCADNAEDGGSAWLASRDADQLAALQQDLEGWFIAGTGMTANQFAARALFERVKSDNNINAMHDYQTAALYKGMQEAGKGETTFYLESFFDWYKGKIIMPIQMEAKEQDE